MKKNTLETIQEANRRGYNAISGQFASTRSHPWREWEFFRPYFEEKRRLHVLDLGCGNGRFFNWAKQFDVSYTGVDLSEELIALAQQHYANTSNKPLFFQGSMTDLEGIPELTGAHFDIIVMNASFHHIFGRDIQENVLKQCSSLLAPGGVVMMLNWNLWRLSRKEKTVWRYGTWPLHPKAVRTIWHGTQNHPLYYYAFTVHVLSELLKRVGFLQEANTYVSKDKEAHWWNARNILTIGRTLS